jgi:CelD/BcsL family acetyltransferase involved in cellulose biosynthesis
MPYWIDPLADSRWGAFIERHPSSSVFHTSAWLAALRRTYGFEPAAITTSPPGDDLANAIPFCRVRSILTGKRLVSLPFSDHCRPLASPEELPSLLEAVQEAFRRERLKYVELRPLGVYGPPGFACSQRYVFHALDLRPPLGDILKKFHKDCIGRKIRRAAREGLATDAGRSDRLLDAFYDLQVITRRRHGLPPQPRKWFKNLLNEMGENATIRVAHSHERPVASILTLRHKRTEVYKYGCSKAEDNNLGGMQLLLWKAIEDAKNHGMEEMDLGRGDLDDAGLSQFKERWGAERHPLSYYRFPAQATRKARIPSFARLPRPVLIAIGRLLYRHMA